MAARGRALSRRARRAVLVAGAALVLLSCKKKDEPRVFEVQGESAVLPRATPKPFAPTDTRDNLRTIEVAGRSRRYLVVTPDITPGRTYPLVLVFHGDGGEAIGFHDAWPFERATGKDAILAYPDGIGRTWDLETKTGNKDILFAVALVDRLASELPIDRSRVFSTGYSSGGFFSNVLACHKPDLLRAIASNAGGAPYNQDEKWPNGFPKCPGQKPVATLALHGERDYGVSLDSGRFSAQYWAYVNGCTTTEMETTGYAECRAFRGCPQGKAVAFCSVPSLGHWVWDQAAEASWTFFQKQ